MPRTQNEVTTSKIIANNMEKKIFLKNKGRLRWHDIQMNEQCLFGGELESKQLSQQYISLQSLHDANA